MGYDYDKLCCCLLLFWTKIIQRAFCREVTKDLPGPASLKYSLQIFIKTKIMRKVESQMKSTSNNRIVSDQYKNSWVGLQILQRAEYLIYLCQYVYANVDVCMYVYLLSILS